MEVPRRPDVMNESMSVDAVRQVVYRAVARTGEVPSVEAIVKDAGLAGDAVVAALRMLADAHVLVLETDGRTIRFAPPFSGIPTGFRVASGGRSYFAPCAWDAFGIPAALHADADVDARCGNSGVPLACGVRNGVAYGDGVIHLLVPAARFWDDIVHT